ncbi:ABC transporter ATP-binding protein [Staphylococcus simulans]|uniref:ABC transporter ATP-binding protein n=1 Tax=Staphylococcus simulans TaxID=1286 RepID=UPI0021D347FD|nr:ABC transporter ATP-binding protein [Staphylococcus simulans]UXR50348.1 ABC transporter ATP-binding protein [Staphylococcus simulans]
MIAKVEHLSKSFGDVEVIKDISFELETGKIHAILGPNGSGKTTTIKLMTGLLKPDKGAVTLFNQTLDQPHFNEVRQAMAVQNDGALYENLTVAQNLKFWAQLYGLDTTDFNQNSIYLLKVFDIEAQMQAKAGALSKGMKQKVLLIRAMMTNPKLLILDEPTSGLDPIASERFIELLKQMAKRQGTTILMCTHQLQGLEKIADNIFIMKKGTFIAQGTVSQLIQTEWPGHEFHLKVSDVQEAERLLSQASIDLVSFYEVRDDQLIVKVDAYKDISEVITVLVKENIKVYEVTQYQHALQELYEKKVGGL